MLTEDKEGLKDTLGLYNPWEDDLVLDEVEKEYLIMLIEKDMT